MFTHMSYTQRTHQHCQHTFPICVVHDQLQLCIHPCSDDVNRQWQQCWYCLPIQTVYTEDVWNRYKQWLITWSEIWRVGRMCQNLPASMLQQILHTTTAMRCWIVLEQYDTTFKQFSLFMANSWPLLSYKSVQYIGHWLSYQLAWDGQARVHFSWRTWHAWLSEHPDWATQFSSSVTFGNTIQHSVISADSQMNTSMTQQQLKHDWERHCLDFSKAADGWQQEHTWLFDHCWTCLKSTLHKLFVSLSCLWNHSKHLLERFWHL